MNIPFFKFDQSWTVFIGHKTNKVGLTTIALACFGFYLGQVEWAGFTGGILGGLALISNRDTMHKLGA